MATMALTRLACSALLLVSTLTWACRSVTLCSGPTCADEQASNDTVGTTSSSGGAAGEPGDHFAGESSTAGEAGAAGAAEPMSGVGGEAGAQTVPLVCDTGRGDCDGSTLNACESDLNRSVRHCGACDSPCSGLCMAGTCKEAELLFVDGSPRDRVATQSALFTIMSNFQGSQRWLYRFDLTSGQGTELFELLGSQPTVSLGPDRVYVKDGAQVIAVSFDGERVEPVMGPAGPLSVWHFGATASGLYYVDSDDDLVAWTLNHRANQASEWQVIYEGDKLEIVSTGPQAIALLTGDYFSETRELMRAKGDTVSTFGTVPELWGDIGVYEDRIAVVNGADELLWYGEPGEQPVVQTIPVGFYWDETFVPAPEGLAILSQTGLESSVQCYSATGPQWTPVGISRAATLVFVNRTHLWYLDNPSPLDPPLLMRARLVEHADL
jgi:hypothetical protein